MAKKCIGPAYTTNYLKMTKSHIDKEKTPVYRFPADPAECAKWIKSFPYQNLKPSKDSVICQKHWPTSFDAVSKNGKLRPRDPPSIWPGVAQAAYRLLLHFPDQQRELYLQFVEHNLTR